MFDGHLTAEQIHRFCKATNGIEICRKVNLAQFTSFNIGGPAELFVAVDKTSELSEVFGAAQQQGIPVFCLGGGTNLLVSDEGYDGLVVKANFRDIEIDSAGCTVRAGAAVQSAVLVEELIEAGMGGLEFAAGLPGTVGGAVAGNAGCFGRWIGEALIGATVMQVSGQVEKINDPGWFEFDYRSSQLLKSGAVLVDATFALKPVNSSDLQSQARQYIGVRRTKHPAPGTHTAGSYFKNLPASEPGGPRRAAGELLDKVGARTLSVGDAAVFERHANIVINRANAAAQDVLALAKEMRRRVQTHFGVELTPEVHFVGKAPLPG